MIRLKSYRPYTPDMRQPGTYRIRTKVPDSVLRSTVPRVWAAEPPLTDEEQELLRLMREPEAE
jgi:hypothetical protein